MTEETRRKLERLKHHQTRYEHVLVTPEGTRVLLYYSIRRSKARLLDSLRERREELAHVFGERVQWADWDAKHKRWLLPRGAYACIGRTQREAYLEGELPLIGEEQQQIESEPQPVQMALDNFTQDHS